jgi:hypothetical protein
MIARRSPVAQSSLMYRRPEWAKRAPQLRAANRFALWVVQARDFAQKMAHRKRQIALPDFACRQIVRRELALQALASNQIAAQVA